MKVLVGLSTAEHIRKADFLPYFLGLEKPEGTLITTIHGQSPAEARNLIIKQAVANECTHILFLDDDMAYAPDILLKLLAHDKDIVSALYLMRSYPHFPAAFDQQFENGYNKFLYLTPDQKGLKKVTNCGLGCVLIKTHIFNKLEQPYVRLGEIIKDGWCDDVGFFNRVRAAGFEIYCDLDTKVGHLTTITLFPTYVNNQWFTEYKHQGGNVIFPQTIPNNEVTENAIKDMKDDFKSRENERFEKEKLEKEELAPLGKS